MALGLLCLGLTLLGALRTQAQDIPSTLIQAPPLSKIPLQPDFQDDQECSPWNSTLVPCDQHGQCTLLNMTNSDTESYTWRVAATDYHPFAMMYIEYKLQNSTFFRAKLNGRTKELSSEVQEHFFEFSKSLGLSEDNIIFFEPIGWTLKLSSSSNTCQHSSCPETMALGLLCPGLILVGSLKIQTNDISPSLTPPSSWGKVSLQPDFQDDQGKGLIVGMALSSSQKGKGTNCNCYMFSDNYKLNNNDSYDVTTNSLLSPFMDHVFIEAVQGAT
ncbi:Neutrophil gelatinase-associated lipocalin [Fukomys damarensis]|uniref:Neutrophil gelatinase-associated lipocalin n=1 Tax=Fukomys damarensis TaxID=885580 RepID=A0A091E4H3_FUKDA|nr:Neutrophil gelatinase-associated lipocalin [Fukomys damarensis]